MPQYRVRPGYRHGVGKKYGPGDTVTLTEREAVGFLDKLERVEEPKAKVTPVPADKPAGEPTLQFWQEPAPTVTIAPVAVPQSVADTPPPDTFADFTDVVGIGKDTEAALHAAGYTTWEDILQTGIGKLREEFPSVSASRMTALFTRAQREAN